MVKKK